MFDSRHVRAARSGPACWRLAGALSLVALLSVAARAEVIPVRHPQGCAHGFVEVDTLEGIRIAVGDLKQRVHGNLVTSTLTLQFADGSLDDETTVYSQRGTFRLVSDHHIQRGPSFPTFLDATVDASKGLITSRDPSGQVKENHLDLPADVYNGLPSSLLMNVLPSTPETTVAVVVPSATPRLIHLSMKKAGEVPFTIGGLPRTATDFVVHVELGGVVGLIAPVVGKQPVDYHVWILGGPDPAFIREEGPLYVGGPVWRIQQVSAAFPK